MILLPSIGLFSAKTKRSTPLLETKFWATQHSCEPIYQICELLISTKPGRSIPKLPFCFTILQSWKIKAWDIGGLQIVNVINSLILISKIVLQYIQVHIIQVTQHCHLPHIRTKRLSFVRECSTTDEQVTLFEYFLQELLHFFSLQYQLSLHCKKSHFSSRLLDKRSFEYDFVFWNVVKS